MRKVKYPTDFLVLGSVQDSFCPIIFGRSFLSTCGAIIDCKKGKVSVEFNGEPYEFNFSQFSKQPRGTDLSSNDKIIEEIASIAILLTILCSNLWMTTRMTYICRRGMN